MKLLTIGIFYYFINLKFNLKAVFINILAVVATLLTLNSCSNTEINNTVQVQQNAVVNYEYVAIETDLIKLINDYRATKGLNELQLDNYISKISENHDNYMIDKNEISHDLFDLRFKDITQNRGGQKVSENVAFNFNSAQSTLNAWLNSPEHRKNIEGNFTHCGISVKMNQNGVRFYTNIFMKK